MISETLYQIPGNLNNLKDDSNNLEDQDELDHFLYTEKQFTNSNLMNINNHSNYFNNNYNNSNNIKDVNENQNSLMIDSNENMFLQNGLSSNIPSSPLNNTSINNNLKKEDDNIFDTFFIPDNLDTNDSQNYNHSSSTKSLPDANTENLKVEDLLMYDILDNNDVHSFKNTQQNNNMNRISANTVHYNIPETEEFSLQNALSSFTDTDPNYLSTINNLDKLNEINPENEEANDIIKKLKFGVCSNIVNSANSAMINAAAMASVKLLSSDRKITSAISLPKSSMDWDLHTDYSTIDDSSKYKIKIIDLPDFSRVETQIKIDLEISPKPEFPLVAISTDLISKKKLCLKDGVDSLDEKLKENMLYFDCYVVSQLRSEDIPALKNKSEDGLLTTKSFKSCSICDKCIKRELKRASRRKSGLSEDGLNWIDGEMKKAIIFNTKEIISMNLPASSTIMSDELNSPVDLPKDFAKLELNARIVCYCRHHNALKGFKLLFVLRNHKGEIVGKNFSNSIMIMDRKKPVSSKMESKNDVIKLQKKRAKSVDINPLTPPSHDDDSSGPSNPSKRGKFTPSMESKSEIVQITKVDSVNNRNFKNSSIILSPDSSNMNIMSCDNSSNSVSSTSAAIDNYIPPITVDLPGGSPGSDNYSSTRSPGAFSSTTVTSFTNLSSPGFDIKNKKLMITPQTLSPQTNIHDIVLPTIQKVIPAEGPIRGGVEITLLGVNFRPGLNVKFGDALSLGTHCWSENTIVTFLPPASKPGQVLISFDSSDGFNDVDMNDSISQSKIFTYTDDTDRQLIELALQIVGLKMSGKLEDARNIARRIIGNDYFDGNNNNNNNNNNDKGNGGSGNGSSGNGSSSNGSSNQNSGSSGSSNGFNSYKNNGDNNNQENSYSTKGNYNYSAGLDDTESLIVKLFDVCNYSSSSTVPNWQLCNREQQTILHLACLNGYSKIVYFLINRGARINIKDINGYTPLHFAAISGNARIIRMLFKSKVNFNSKTNNGLSAVDVAKDTDTEDFIEELNNFQQDIFALGYQSNSSVSSISSVEESIAPYSMRKMQHVNIGIDDVHDSDVADDEGEGNDDEEQIDTLRNDQIRSKFESQGSSALPNYFDLFPGGDLKSESLAIENCQPDHQEPGINLDSEGLSAEIEVAGSDEDQVESDDSQDRNARNYLLYFNEKKVSGSGYSNDKMLLFFWVPFFTIIASLAVYSYLTGITFFDTECGESTITYIRLAIYKLMVGKERVERLINDQLGLLSLASKVETVANQAEVLA